MRAVSDSAVERFDSARNEIADCSSGLVRDALLEALDERAGQVETEQLATASGPSLAERITQALATGEVSEEMAALQGAQLIALEWDIDPQAADAQLCELVDPVGGVADSGWDGDS